MPGADITPVVLSRDEEDNLGRTLDALGWATRVLVMDSGSTDRTRSIAEAYPNVIFVVRPFAGHGDQWNAAVRHEAVTTHYVLALDADMSPEPGLVEEMDARVVGPGRAGASMRFLYRVGGKNLLGSLYPAQMRLFRRDAVRVGQAGHTHTFEVSEAPVRLRHRLVHDDRKPWERFVASQVGYAQREHARIVAGRDLRFRDRLRKLGWTPPLIGTLAWLKAGGPLKGRAAIRYAHERALYETLLTLRLAAPADEGSPPERAS